MLPFYAPLERARDVAIIPMIRYCYRSDVSPLTTLAGGALCHVCRARQVADMLFARRYDTLRDILPVLRLMLPLFRKSYCFAAFTSPFQPRHA